MVRIGDLSGAQGVRDKTGGIGGASEDCMTAGRAEGDVDARKEGRRTGEKETE